MLGSASIGASKGTGCTHSTDAKCSLAASMMIFNLSAGHAAARNFPCQCVSVLSQSSHTSHSWFSRESLRTLNTHDKCFYISPAPIHPNGCNRPPVIHYQRGHSFRPASYAPLETPQNLSAHLRRSKSITCTTLLKKQAATLSPVLFHATSKIPEPPLSVLTKAPLLTSHICRHLSKDPEARRSPDGLKATL